MGDRRAGRDELREVYALVLRAQVAGARRGAARAAAAARSTRSARDIIDAAGHGEHFGHGLGHGVGLEIHEAPRLARTVRRDARGRATS